MKRLALLVAVAIGLCVGVSSPAQAAHGRLNINLGVGNAGVYVGVGNAGFRNAGYGQRYVPSGIAVVNEPIYRWVVVRDPLTGATTRVVRTYWVRRAVQLYLDTWTGTQFYIDSYGNPVQYPPRFPW